MGRGYKCWALWKTIRIALGTQPKEVFAKKRYRFRVAICLF